MPIKMYGVYMIRNQRWSVFISLVCLVISLVTQFAGYVSAGWIYLKGDLNTIHAGLWYRVTCKRGEDCTIKDMVNNEDMLEYQVETSLAFMFCITAVLCVILHMRRRRDTLVTFLVIAVMSSSLSGVLALTASVKMGHKQSRQHLEQIHKYGSSVYKIPYSAVITGVGGLVTSLVSIALIVEIHVFNKQRHRYPDVSEDHVVMPTMDTGTEMSSYTDRQFTTMTTNTVANSFLNRAMTNVKGSMLSGDKSRVTRKGHGIYDKPKLPANLCPSTIVNVSNHVTPVLGKEPLSEQSDVDFRGNAILQNGQHIVMNDIYNI